MSAVAKRGSHAVLRACVYRAPRRGAGAGRRIDRASPGIIEQGGGKVTKLEPWGLRSLTYKIKKNRKGHYVHTNFDSPWAPVAEVERQLRLNEDVIRYLTVRVEELDNEPSAGMLAKQARERRDAKWGRREDEFGGGGFESA